MHIYSKFLKVKKTGIRPGLFTRVGQKINLQSTYFRFCTFSSYTNGSTFRCCAILLHFHIVPAITEPFILSCDELFCSLLISVRLLRYHPPCNSCLHRAIHLGNLWSAKILLQHCKQTTIAQTNQPTKERIEGVPQSV